MLQKANLRDNTGTVEAPFDDYIMTLCERRPDVIVLTADLAKVIDITTLPKKLPKQFLNVGMAEQNLMTIAGGLAKSGYLPIATTFAVYATRRAYDQIVISLGTGPSHGIVIGFTPGITNPARIHHQSIEDLSMMRAVPGITVIDPADATELGAALEAAAEHNGLVYMRAFRGTVNKVFEDSHRDHFKIGDVYQLRNEGGVGLISTGIATQWTLEASKILSRRGVVHSILHVPTIKPVDTSALSQYLEEHQTVFTIENHTIIGGLGSLIAETIAENNHLVRLIRIGIADRWAPGGTLDFIRRSLGLDAESLADHIEREGKA